MGGKEGEGFWQDERGQRQKESMGVSLDPRSVGTRVTLALYWRDSSLFFTQNCRCSLPVSVCTVTHTHTHTFTLLGRLPPRQDTYSAKRKQKDCTRTSQSLC